MSVYMMGVDYKHADLWLREQLAFDNEETERIVKGIAAEKGVLGCVLLATCNRTELYVSAEAEINTANLLFRHCGAEYTDFAACIYRKEGFAAAEYLAQLACGLHSAILCEEQISGQIGAAAELSRICGCMDAVLNTMFRLAVTAGKAALTQFQPTAVPKSAAVAAIARAEQLFGTLAGKKALVIGNGKMGVLSAELLLKKQCEVYITLRRYKHGENIIPTGAAAIEYKERMRVFAESDFVISATRSPHYTIHCSDIGEKRPYCIFDLALPRDVEPGTEKLVSCYSIDDLTDECGIDKETMDAIKAIAKSYAMDFESWCEYRSKIKEQ